LPERDAIVARVSAPREHPIGPWLVALGAGLWGTESAWRIPLAKVLDEDVVVLWEHVILVACALPFVLPRLGELRRVSRTALAWLVFSGLAGSALGAWLFTLALTHGNPTAVNVVLNVQPLLSTTAAWLLFGDRLARGFYPWAALAVAGGVAFAEYSAATPADAPALSVGLAYALATALCWGLSTVAGRRVMVEMSLPLASGLRVIIGLGAMIVFVAAQGKLGASTLWPAAAAADAGKVVALLLLLAILSGGVPLVVYFKGLELTRASTAGYFEMMQTLVAVFITWGVFGSPLTAEQVGAAIIVIGAVAMVQRAQATTALPYEPR
jgi:drug/metabolite transporter (DMT)-like permease